MNGIHGTSSLASRAYRKAAFKPMSSRSVFRQVRPVVMLIAEIDGMLVYCYDI